MCFQVKGYKKDLKLIIRTVTNTLILNQTQSLGTLKNYQENV